MNQLKKINNKQLTSLPIVGPDAYKNAIRQFNRWLDGRPVNIESIIDYLQEQQKTKKPNTISAMKFGIKRAIKEVMSMGARKIDIAMLDEEFKKIKIGKRDPKVYAHRLPSKKTVFEAIEKTDIRTGLIIEALFYTGMRISELINIKLQNCSTDNNYVYIRIMGKGSKEREVFIRAELFKRIIKEFSGNEYLFESFRGKRYRRESLWKKIHDAGKLVGRDDFHPHMLRHVCATYLLKEKGMSLKAVSVFLGHSDVAITANVYIEDVLTPDDVYGKIKK